MMNNRMPAWFERFMTMPGEIYRQLEGRETLKLSLHGQPYFLKRHRGVGWREIFKNILQGKLPVISAKNEYEALKKLATENVLVPEVKLYAQHGLNPAKCASLIIMESIEPSISLEDFCRDWKQQPPDFKLKRKLILAVAYTVKTMHAVGINHRDLYICHFLLKPESLSLSLPLIYLIDLHRAQCRQKVPARWLLKDLSGLYFSVLDIGLSKRDFFYFLTHYFNLPLKKIFSQHSSLLKEIESKALKLYRKENQ